MFCDGATSRHREQLNTGAQLQTFPYPMTSKLFLSSNDFMAKSLAQTLPFKSAKDNEERQIVLRYQTHLCGVLISVNWD